MLGADLNAKGCIEGGIQGSGIAACTPADGVVVGRAPVSIPFAEQESLRGTERILLVEDEEFVRRVTAEVLRSAGYQLMVASDAYEAFEISRQCHESPDLLLCDVVLPKKNGRALANEFRCWYPHTPVLLMSGYAEQIALAQSHESDYEYLAKPFSVQTLLRKVSYVLHNT
jgi:two-component system cell cycle sensor histidine kinase/response regulator CckA